MKFIHLLILISSASTNTFAQKLILKGSVYPILGKLVPVVFSSPQSNPINNDYDFTEIKINANNRFYAEYPLKKPSALDISYGSGSFELFVRPNDTVEVSFFEKQKPDTIYNGNVTNYYNDDIVVKSKHVEETMFFDSLTTFTHRDFGNLYYPASKDLTFQQVCNKIDSNYQDELNYLKRFSEKYHISDELVKCASLEIRGDFLLKYIGHILLWQNNDNAVSAFKEKIKDEKFSMENCSIAKLYNVAAISYVRFYFANGYSANRTVEDVLKNQFEKICVNFAYDEALKNYLLTDLMARFLEKTPSNYKFYLNEYNKICTNQYYTDGINAKYSAINKITESGLDSNFVGQSIVTLDNKKIRLGDIVKSGKPLIIDFWASWCGPCIVEMPRSKQFEIKYEGKVNYIYISVDKNYKDWKNAVKEHGLSGGQYCMPESFASELCKHLHMTSVPRTILFDRNGKVYSYLVTSPSNKEAYQKTIEDCLSK